MATIRKSRKKPRLDKIKFQASSRHYPDQRK